MEGLHSVFSSSDGIRVWASGEMGTIVVSSDGGETWSAQTFLIPGELTSISGNGRRLVAVGYGAILTSTNDGATWNPIVYGYHPAPWFWFASLLSFASLIFGIVRLQRPTASPRESIENAAVADTPVTALKQDLLDAAKTVSALAEFLRNTNTEPPVTVSIEGSWGTGKSSIMRMLEAELRAAGVPTVWFNAWHNEGEEQMLAFLLESIREQAFGRWSDPREVPFRVRLLAIRFQRWPVILILLVAAALFVVHPLLDWIVNTSSDRVANLRNLIARLEGTNWAQIVTVITATGAAIPLVRKVISLATGISAKPSELLEESGAKSSGGRTSLRSRFAREFDEAARALGSGRRITIFIDDLDRCQPAQVRQALEAVNFVVSSAACFVVMGFAREMVEASIGLGFKEIAEELQTADDLAAASAEKPEADGQRELAAKRRRLAFASNYLQKLVNLPIKLRPYKGDALAKVAAAQAKPEPRRSWIRDAVPYALLASAAVTTLLLWNTAGLPKVDAPDKELPAESLALPNNLKSEQLKSLAVQRDAHGKLIGETRTYETGQAAPATSTSIPPTTAGPAAPAKNPPPPNVSGVPPAQTYNPKSWLWWMMPGIALAAGLVIAALRIRRQVVIRDSTSFRDAIRLWRVVYENEIRTPREIKRFVNELRYKAIRFRGPVPKAGLLHRAAVEPPESIHEATLIALAILDRLGKGQYDPGQVLSHLEMPYDQTLRDHISRFGEPTAEDWKRYRELFGRS